MFFYEICKIFKSTHFEEHLQTDASSSSSLFKLDLVDLTVFPNLHLRLKFQPFTTVCISKFSNFCSHPSSFLCYQVPKLQNFIFSFISSELTSKVTDVSAGPSVLSIILWEYYENDMKTFWYYPYENKRIISRKIVRIFWRLFKVFPPIRLSLPS